MVALKNKLRRMRVFNLDAPFFVKRRGESRYGKPETLTLLSLERRGGLPDAIVACTEVKSALEAGTLRQFAEAEEPKPKPEEAKPKASEKTSAEKKKTVVRRRAAVD